MRSQRCSCPVLLILTVLLVLPGTVGAQTGGIAGQVSDSTGGVLPGVTVEASSPAQIEQVRTAVTDGQGNYNIVALVPGTYVVTFTLPGFSTVRREGVELNSGFTANVDAELAVGGVEETVTVTGATPTVDVQNVRAQRVLEKEVLDLLPVGENLSGFAGMTLGVRVSGNATGGVDVGGAGGEMGSASVHNNRSGDMKITQEGMNTMTTFGGNGGNIHFGQHYNMEGVQEVTIGHNGMGAESETAGLQINYIPKEGGNTFSVSARSAFTNESFQSNNLTTELEDRGVTTAPAMREIWDYGASVGGPIRQDRLWFFTAHRWWGSEQYAPGLFFNAVQGTTAPNGRPLYEEDLNRRAYQADPNQENSVRLTWQATQQDKFTYFGNYGNQCVCFRLINATRAPEAGQNTESGPTQHLSQFTWTRAHSNSLLFEAGFNWLNNPFVFARSPSVGENDIPITELDASVLGLSVPFFRYNAFVSNGIPPFNEGDPSQTGQTGGRGSVSYVTGSHSFKFGGIYAHGVLVGNGSWNVLEGFGPVSFTLNGGVPVSLALYNHPQFRQSEYLNVGIFAQDQWTMNRVTLNLGVRGDFFNGYTPASNVPDTVYLPGFPVDRIEDTPSWRDISPRFGLAWDVIGDGKTAVKASVGRYVSSQGGGLPQAANPASSISTNTTRTWTDANGDFFPDGDPANPVANGEMGPSANPAFGLPIVVRTFDDSYMLDNRPYTWQMSAGVEQELQDNVRVAVTYFRTSHHNQFFTDNTVVGPGDYDPYCVTAPTNSLLPGGGGNEICGQADVSFAGRRTFPNFRTGNEEPFGNRTEVFNGVDFEVSARFDNGALIQGGTNIGRSVSDRCFVVDSPAELYQCRIVTPLEATQQVKFQAAYPLPFGVALSAVYQLLPGREVRARATFFNDAIAPSLGRNLSSCAAPTGPCSARVSVDVFEERNSEFEDRVSMLDFRVMKDFIGGFGRVRVVLDLYNAFNANTVLRRSDTFGTTGAGWGRPTAILSGRLVKFSAQFTY